MPDLDLIPTDDLVRELALRSRGMVLVRIPYGQPEVEFSASGPAPIQLGLLTQARDHLVQNH